MTEVVQGGSMHQQPNYDPREVRIEGIVRNAISHLGFPSDGLSLEDWESIILEIRKSWDGRSQFPDEVYKSVFAEIVNRRAES